MTQVLCQRCYRGFWRRPETPAWEPATYCPACRQEQSRLEFDKFARLERESLLDAQLSEQCREVRRARSLRRGRREVTIVHPAFNDVTHVSVT